MLLLLPLACQEPFAEDRHDLASFRIAGVSAVPSEAGTELRALVWSGLGAWHEAPPEVAWTVTGPDGATLTATGVRASIAAVPPLSIALTATAPDGAQEQAVLEVAGDAVVPDLAGWTRVETDLTAQDAARTVAVRAAALEGSSTGTGAGGALRLTLPLAEGQRARWMGAAGTFAELDASRTDWFAADLTLDDGEVVSNTPLTDGVYPLLALAQDLRGGNAWIWLDAPVGVGAHLQVAGRVWPIEGDYSGEGWFEATLEASDDLAGIRLVDIAPATGPEASPALCGSAAGAAFDLTGIAEGWCGRDEVVGARVVLAAVADTDAGATAATMSLARTAR